MAANARNSLRIATAILATFSTVPFFAQTANDAQIHTGASVSNSQAVTASGTESLGATGQQPLEARPHEGFWGHLNPMARKSWVHRQVDPIKDRLNELDEVSASNAQDIKNFDTKAQAGITKARSEAELADQHATLAGNTANQAQQMAQQANAQATQIDNAVNTLDQYEPVSRVEIRFSSGQTMLGANSKAALDQLVNQVQGEHGYIFDIQGYSPLHGSEGISNSHRMASAVTRYLVTKHQVPLYRIHEIGLGNAQLVDSRASARHRSIVEVTLMHNSLSALSASNTGASTTGAAQSGTAQSSSNGTASQPIPNQ